MYIHIDKDDEVIKAIRIYSCGVGEDISFDMAVMNDYDCEIFAFDPTPKSMDWIKMQSIPVHCRCLRLSSFHTKLPKTKCGLFSGLVRQYRWICRQTSYNGEK
jgi:hypothetical protein